MLNVLFLSNIPSPYRVDFFNELGKNSNLTVIFERKFAKNRNQKWLKNSFKSFTAYFLSGIPFGDDSALCFEVIRHLADLKFHIIVVGGYSTPTGMLAIIFMKLRNIPFILSADGGILRKKEIRLLYILKRLFLSSANAYLSSGDQTTKYLIHYGAKKSNIYVYPFTSINERSVLDRALDKKEKINIRKKLKIFEDHIVLAVGQFIPRKGFDILIKSARLVTSSVGFYIVGGKPTDEYLSLLKCLNLKNVHFVEFKKHIELTYYYKMADIFVLPTREDIWGLVVNEAMAYGLPVITTNNCLAGLELVENYSNGFIVPTNDEVALANKIELILNSSAMCTDMSNKSLAKIKKYTIEIMAKKHIEIFNKIATKT